MDFNALAEFVELANSLSFTATARSLHISQSTLSRHISELERELKVRLFDRTPNSIRLTTAGKVFYKNAEGLVRGMHSTIGEVRSAELSQVTTLSVTGSTIEPAFARFISLMTTRAACDRLPVSYSYRFTRSLDNSSDCPAAFTTLRNKSADFLIEIVPDDMPCLKEFDVIKLFREPLTIVASADNPLARKKRVTFDDLRRCSLLAFEVYQTCFDILTRPFVNAGYDPRDIESVIIDDCLDFPRHIGTLADYEIMPIEEGLCNAHGFAVDDQSGAVRLNVDDDRLAVTYYAIFRKDDTRPAIMQTKGLIHALLNERAQRCTPDMVMPDGTLRSCAFARPLPRRTEPDRPGGHPSHPVHDVEEGGRDNVLRFA